MAKCLGSCVWNGIERVQILLYIFSLSYFFLVRICVRSHLCRNKAQHTVEKLMFTNAVEVAISSKNMQGEKIFSWQKFLRVR